MASSLRDSRFFLSKVFVGCITFAIIVFSPLVFFQNWRKMSCWSGMVHAMTVISLLALISLIVVFTLSMSASSHSHRGTLPSSNPGVRYLYSNKVRRNSHTGNWLSAPPYCYLTPHLWNYRPAAVKKNVLRYGTIISHSSQRSEGPWVRHSQ